MPYIIILVRVTELRSWPTRPAEWNVEPEVKLGPVDQDDVAPAKLGEVVGDRCPADAAPDDHRPGVLNHGASLSGCRVPSSALAANRQWQAALPESRKSPAVGMNSHS